MSLSYSLHISSKGHAVSTGGKLKQVGKHNLRKYKSEHYDKSNIKILVGSENILDDVKEIYHQEFDEALAKYNDGKRSDRQIADYFEHVSESRSDVAVEIVIQIGDREFWADKSIVERENAMNSIFEDQLRGLEEFCPDFRIASAVVHYDESSPHMHIVGVPVARGYEKGMEVQCAKTKVFTKKTLSNLQDKMRGYAEDCIKISQKFGDEKIFSNVKLKEKSKGRNKDIPKQSLNEFYDLESKKEELENECLKLKENSKSIENSMNQLVYEKSVVEDELKSVSAEIEDKKYELEQLEYNFASRKFDMQQLEKKYDELQAEYEKIRKAPPKQEVVEVKKIVEIPKEVKVEKIVEIPKEVKVEKIVEVKKEVNVNYKELAEKAIDIFYKFSDWLNKNYLIEKLEKTDPDLNKESIEFSNQIRGIFRGKKL